jgi:CheY-like chemotaxis protein
MLRVLIIEDNETDIVIVRLAVELMGHEVVCVTNANAALQKLNVLKFDLVISDINLPGELSGYGLVEAIRKRPFAAGTPIIFMTSNVETSGVQSAIELGAADFVVKPIDPDLLQQRVRRILAKRHPGAA